MKKKYLHKQFRSCIESNTQEKNKTEVFWMVCSGFLSPDQTNYWGSCICRRCIIILQTLFNCLSMSFWRNLASVFASNDLFRSGIAGSFPLFGAPLFSNADRALQFWGVFVLQ